ncbi:MAG: DNA-binding MarR family transcriptional regulator [Salibacteraceae bacterium]|jgi:DNA-binding MarR family transcriptional regulator
MLDSKNLLLENQLCFPIYATSRLITRLYKPLLNEIGLTYPQYLVMLTLWKQDSQRVSDIGDQLFLKTNTITPLLHKMKDKGLVEKAPNPEDERTVLIQLTKKGNLLREKAAEIPTKLANSSNIPSEELMQLKNGMWKMLKYLH